MRVNEKTKLEPPVRRGKQTQILLDGQPILAYEGETVAAALFAASHLLFRRTESNQPRGVYCGIGQCHECRMIIDDVPNVRACITYVKSGMKVQFQDESKTLRATDLGAEREQ